MKQILYATTNPNKLLRMKENLVHLPLKILSLQDFNCSKQVVEDGNTLQENAIKKAACHFHKAGLPTMAVDYGLYIERFPEDKQPGMYVRRINGTDDDVSDEQMREYYIDELNKVGGESKAYWLTAIALAVSTEQVYCETFRNDTFFTSKISPVIHPGEPLSSFHINPENGKYYSEMTPKERMIIQKERSSGIINFMEQHFDLI